MANNFDLEFAGLTDTGLVRAQNEDAILISASHRFAILADGMGGYNAGEVASGIASSVMKAALEQALDDITTGGAAENPAGGRPLIPLVVDAAQKANQAVLDAAQAEPQYQGMGTTLVAAVFRQNTVTIAHVGDSRAYRFRQGVLTRMTRDHSLLQEQIDAGLIDPALARFAQIKNLVTRAVGVGTDMEVEAHDHPVQGGDIYLLCSDGLSDMLADDDIAQVLAQGQGELEACCRTLVQQANDNGGFDNISVILARVPGAVTPPGLLERILAWVS
ncbi:Stp1/IreP family PP2C-type Ser/Thr phosphatase [Noviherbaspirillum denitrificans]|uniref:Protein phosphatase n=1 Tax=Noviherbaspirillum denitrificans TaxID=1968433 RepID=A0A254TAX2_9BURK|nr:Stp1/IreP family PP2C-type Ser/Thr phosphatase [Noviherbaspirillum denitrificans]OWW19799.1 protein phosphatase [Noviherbaspirillum denitrificans]